MVSREGKTELFARWYQGSMVVTDEGVGTGLRWWVDSNAGTRGGDSAGHGHNPDAPFLTVNFAYTQCVADRGDIIYVMEGHIEDSDAVLFDASVAGVTLIGLGNGTNMPEFHFNNAAATIDVSASNNTIRHIKLLPSAPDVLIGIDIEAAVQNTLIEDIWGWEGEDGAGADEFVTTIEAKAGCHGTRVRRNNLRSHADSAPVQAVLLNGVSDRCEIYDNTMIGFYTTAAIADGGNICTEALIYNNKIKVLDGEPGIELANTTTGFIADNLIESTGINPEVAIVAADCSWFNNWAVVADGSGAVKIGGTDESAAIIAGVLAGSSTGIGSVVAIQSNVLSSAIANNAQTSPMSVAATGVWILEEIIVETDGVGWAAPANIEFSTDNVFGSTGAGAPLGVEVIASFAANLTVSSKDWTSSLLPCTIENGAIIYIHGDTLAGTGTGDANVTMILRRVTEGATIAAVDVV